ncbi:MAG: outer membrane beta-barrel protein [Sporomusa sp.]
MKKKVLLALATAMAVTSVSFASPLSDYEKGNVVIDLNTSISPDVKIDGYSFDGKSRLGAGVTYGIGNKMAVQYKYLDNKTKDYYYYGNINAEVTGHELDVLYQVQPNVSAFAGFTRSTGKINWDGYSEKQSRNGYHIGIIGQTKITDDVTGWASVSAGNRLTSYEIGLGYDIAMNAELNLFYRYLKYKDFNVYGEDVDATVKGLGAGVTFKF